jgi:hypothetical protein
VLKALLPVVSAAACLLWLVLVKVLGFICSKNSEPAELDEIRKIRKIRTGIHGKFE